MHTDITDMNVVQYMFIKPVAQGDITIFAIIIPVICWRLKRLIPVIGWRLKRLEVTKEQKRLEATRREFALALVATGYLHQIQVNITKPILIVSNTIADASCLMETIGSPLVSDIKMLLQSKQVLTDSEIARCTLPILSDY